MPFLDHLEELRWRIFKALIAVIIGAVVGLILVMKFGVLQLLIEPFTRVMGPDTKLVFLSPTEPFFLLLKIGALLGLILASPVVIYQAWSFLSPALDKREKRAIVPALYMGLVLFAAGVAMAYFIALPVSLEFLLFVGVGAEYWVPMITAREHIGFATKLLLAFGVLFELPVVVLILSVMGLVTPRFLRTKRRHAIVIITILASFLSPGDVVTVTIMMMVPLIVLYEFSILLSVMVYRGKEKRSQEPEAQEPPPDSVEREE